MSRRTLVLLSVRAKSERGQTIQTNTSFVYLHLAEYKKKKELVIYLLAPSAVPCLPYPTTPKHAPPYLSRPYLKH
jgi:hypothetical protein